VRSLITPTALALWVQFSLGPGALSMTAITIVALGDSTTAGTPGYRSPLESPPTGAGDETSQYAFWLVKLHPEWVVLNRGVNGERSDEIRARFERDVIQNSPTAVVIIAGVNDIYQGQSVEHVTGELHAMYAQARQAGILVVAGSIIPFNTATPDQNARIRQVNDWIHGQPDVVFVDTRSAVAASGNPDLLFESPDGLHPSPAGYRRMAEAIGPVIQRLLQQLRLYPRGKR
jgi:lysophospholipase L1-like esterase